MGSMCYRLRCTHVKKNPSNFGICFIRVSCCPITSMLIKYLGQGDKGEAGSWHFSICDQTTETMLTLSNWKPNFPKQPWGRACHLWLGDLTEVLMDFKGDVVEILFECHAGQWMGRLFKPFPHHDYLLWCVLSNVSHPSLKTPLGWF